MSGSEDSTTTVAGRRLSLPGPWRLAFRSVADLDAALVGVLHDLPPDIRLVAGVPRSGMLPASLLSVYLNVPLTDVDGLLDRRVMGAGMRAGRSGSNAFPPEGSSILVVDDSVGKGIQMREIRARLAPVADLFHVTYLAVYVTPEQRDLVDIPVEILPGKRCFAWNTMHHPLLKSACLEFEDLLAIVPQKRDCGADAIIGAPARFQPRMEVGWVLSRQREECRTAVEHWLDRHGVIYDNLLMGGRGDASWPDVAGRLYGRSGANLMITAHAEAAPLIAQRAGMPVLCLPTGAMHEPGPLRQLPVALRRTPRALLRRMTGRMR